MQECFDKYVLKQLIRSSIKVKVLQYRQKLNKQQVSKIWRVNLLPLLRLKCVLANGSHNSQKILQCNNSKITFPAFQFQLENKYHIPAIAHLLTLILV